MTALLEGVRVLEYSQGIAAPVTGRTMALHGAQVIKVENVEFPDITRQYGSPWLPDWADQRLRMDSSPLVAEFLAGKLSIGLDLSQPGGREILRQLIGIVDVVLMNLNVTVLEKLDLTYESVSRINPAVIYASLTGFGGSQSPYRTFRAWGDNQAALCGIDVLTGWPDRDASGISAFALPDYLSAGHATVAVIAALMYRDLTGEGQEIDMSQMESTVAALGPVILEEQWNPTVTRSGNELADCIFSGVFECRRADEWIAISCETADEFGAMKDLIPALRDVEWPPDVAVVHDIVGAWTRTKMGSSAVMELQEKGVTAAVLADSLDLLIDGHLADREFFKTAPSKRFGRELIAGFPAHFSRAVDRTVRAGPSLGEDSEYIVRQLLGVGEDEFQGLVRSGAVVEMAHPTVTFERPYRKWFDHLKHIGNQ